MIVPLPESGDTEEKSIFFPEKWISFRHIESDVPMQQPGVDTMLAVGVADLELGRGV